MTEDKKIELDVILDPSTVTKNLKISTQYVMLLQNSLIFALSLVENTAEIPNIYAKIDKLVSGDTSVRLTQLESTIFTLTSLIQYIRNEAIKQGNVMKDLKPNPVSRETAAAVLKELLASGSPDFNPGNLKKASDNLQKEAFPILD